MKKIFYNCFVLLVITTPLFSQNGKELFTNTCTACHSIGKGVVVGPDLKDITKTLPEDWLIKWIKGSQAMVEANDPKAVEIFNKFNLIPMPDQTLSDAEIKAVLAYIKTESGGEEAATVKADDKKSVADTNKSLSAADNNLPSTPSSVADKIAASKTTAALPENDHKDGTMPIDSDKFFLSFAVVLILLFFLAVIVALTRAVSKLSKALQGEYQKK
jgi:cytochrome c551/c552